MGSTREIEETLTGGRTRPRRRYRLLAAALGLVLIAAACEATPNDYTGDHKADLVYTSYPSGDWIQVGVDVPIASGSIFASLPGPAADRMAVPGDYNGDLKVEPAEMSGTTWISSALAAPVVYAPAGMPMGAPGAPGTHHNVPPTLLPVPGDYDGTGKTVPAYYDQVDATWWIMGHANPTQFGNPPVDSGTLGYDLPVPADYDGDGHTDIAIYRPTDSTFHYLSSKTGQEVVVQEGQPGDMPVPADYDHVGHAQAAVTSTDFKTWYVSGHTDPVAVFSTGSNENVIATIGDFTGDGRADPAVLVERADGTGNDWDMAGQGTVATLPGSAWGSDDMAIPVALVVSIIRLTLFSQCVNYGHCQYGD